MDISKYKGLFLQETNEHLSGVESGLLSLEKAADPSVVDNLFRHYHSIKGMSASMGYSPLTRLAHAQEDLLDKVRSKKTELTNSASSALFKCLDEMRSMVKKIEDGSPLEGPAEHLLLTLTQAAEGRADEALRTAPPGPVPDEAAQGLRLSNIMKVEGKVFDELLATVGDLFMALSSFKALTHLSRTIEFKDGVHMLGRSVSALHNRILSARMLPIEDLTAGLPRLVRDLTKDTGKEVVLNIEGAEISLDRSILEGLGSPLVHIIRNSVDHGIETAMERHDSGKLSVATIRIKAYTKRDRAIIEISDDGRGIDRERLRQKALARGISAERVNSMTDKEVLNLICLPGLSTASAITSTSGRGVGMDVVKDAVEGFGGSLDIESTPGKGTSIIMELPRTTSITKALLVNIGAEQFLIPISKIERVIEVPASVLVGGVYRLDDIEIPVVPLGLAMGLSGNERAFYTLILVDGGKMPGASERMLAALRVDDFGDEIDAYIKPLLPPISRLWGASGITIMGDGRPVFLLDIQQIISRSVMPGHKGIL